MNKDKGGGGFGNHFENFISVEGGFLKYSYHLVRKHTKVKYTGKQKRLKLTGSNTISPIRFYTSSNYVLLLLVLLVVQAYVYAM